jgi:hypothetical protein
MFALLLALATLGFTMFSYGSDLFMFLLPVAGGSLLVSGGVVAHAKLRLENALTSYALLAVVSLIALTIINPTAEGGVILLAFAISGSLVALRACYVTARRRRYGLSSYYG